MSGVQSPVDAASASILVVDDAKFTCEMIRRGLRGAGYIDIRVARTAREGLAKLRERKADILLADWLMPEMDGLTLTERVRQVDEETNHYTYVVLLTAKEGSESLTEAFEHGVDDFVNKSPDNTELLARIRAAARIAALQNDLLRANRQQLELSRESDSADWFDQLTGLPNRRYLDRQLDKLLRHVDGRGGAACMAMVRVNELADLRRRQGSAAADQICAAAAARLQQTVRPLDWVGRVDEDRFILLMHHDSPEDCHPNAFRRIHQVLNLRAYKTDRGFFNMSAAVALLKLPRKAGTASTDELLARCAEGLEVSASIDAVHMVVPQGKQ